jgi:hypothetical protein
MTATSLSTGLRQLANWVDAHPEFAKDIRVQARAYSVDENIKEWAVALGKCEKEHNDTLFSLVRSFGPVELKAVAWRHNVCKRVVVGVEQVPQQVIPRKVIPAHEKEIVEWECEPLLTKGAS